MFNFIICEDNMCTALLIKGIISEYVIAKKVKCHIELYHDDFEKVIYFAGKNLNHTNVYFLDIILNQDNATGITLARQIRKVDIMAYFVFISSYPEFSFKIFQYKLRALDYINKQDDDIRKRIHECIDTIINEKSKIENLATVKKITLKRASKFFSVNINDIMYFETKPGSRLLNCALKDGTVIDFYDTLKSIMEKLDSRFYQCHRSFIINTRYIKRLDSARQTYTVTMIDGKICDVSKPHWRGLVERVTAAQ